MALSTLRAARRMLAAGMLSLTLAPHAAQAGDYGRTEILGFSRDGGRFAFEEYGVQDGSGFPWSNLYVIDVANDSWVPGSPFRRLDEVDDSQPVDFDLELARTRAANHEAARATVEAAAISGRGDTVAHNPPTERGADPHLMIAGTRAAAPAIGPAIELRLTEKPVPRPASCPEGFGALQGFRLTLTHDGETRVLNDDARLPDSRGCALRYRLDRLVVHYPQETGRPVFAVIVLVERIGFEGPDGRYIAITGRL